MKKRLLALFLVCAMLTGSFASCAGDESSAADEGENTEIAAEGEADDSAIEEEAEEEYVYPYTDLEGRTFRILNMDEYWGMHVVIDPDEATGESLNDAMFDRTRLVEQNMNCVIEDDRIEANRSTTATYETAQKEILAGESTHDAMYIADDRIVNLSSQGQLIDLYTLDYLNLDNDWWDSSYNSAAQIGNSIYGAVGDAHLMAYDSCWCIFFNETIVSNNNLESPYDLVRSGKWTFDRLVEYCEAVANVNTTDSDWTNNGTAVYGLVTHPHAPDKLIFASEVNYVSKSDDGSLTFSAETERFYGIIEKMASFFTTAGTVIEGNSDDFSTNKGYVYTFMNQYAAFLTAEVKTANNIRDMEESFGILPLPKYDESQENYRTPSMNSLEVLTIPITAADSAVSAAVMDALAYEGSRSVVPVYFDQTVAHKGLRNEDSVEMLQIMRSTRSCDIAVAYGWNSTLAESIRNLVFSGKSDASSLLATHKKVIAKTMEKFLKTLNGEE